MKAEDPLCQRNVAALHDRAVRHREMATAGVALMQAGPMRLALETSDAVKHAAVRTERTVRPADRLKVLAGDFIVVEYGISKID
jgi:hypothetical protein